MKLFYCLIILLIPFRVLWSQCPDTHWEYVVQPLTANQIKWQTAGDSAIWHYGENYKSSFDLLTNPLLVTDTLTDVPPGTDASVIIELTRSTDINSDVYSHHAFVIKFDHKVVCDTSLAGGFIEFNIDYDTVTLTQDGTDYSSYWFRLPLHAGNTNYLYEAMQAITEEQDTVYPYYLGSASISSDFYDLNGFADTLLNDTVAFTGTYPNWQPCEFELFWSYGGVKLNDVPDTLLLRFHYVSDASANASEGWAIKNIQTGYAEHPYGALLENTSSSIQCYPNPSNGIICFEDRGVHSNESKSLIIFNAQGEQVYEATFELSLQVNLNWLPSGTYHYMIVHNDMEMDRGNLTISGK